MIKSYLLTRFLLSRIYTILHNSSKLESCHLDTVPNELLGEKKGKKEEKRAYETCLGRAATEFLKLPIELQSANTPGVPVRLLTSLAYFVSLGLDFPPAMAINEVDESQVTKSVGRD